MIIKILLYLFALRPIIDLGWSFNVGIIGLNVAGLVALVTILLGIIYTLQSKKVKILPTIILIAVYTSIITVINASNLYDLDNQLRLLSSMVYIFVVAPNIDLKTLEKTLFLFSVFTLIPIVISYLQVLGIWDYTYWDYIGLSRIGRASGGYLQPSVLTRFLIFGLLYSLYHLYKYKDTMRSNKKKYIYVYILMSIIAILFSYHRTGYFLVLVVMSLWLIFEYKKNIISLFKKTLFASIFIIIIFFILLNMNLFSLNLTDFSELLSLNHIFSFENGEFALNLRGRSTILDYLIDSFKVNPWYNVVFGNGKNINMITGLSMQTADMDFIRMFWNYGFIGVIIWLFQIIFFLNIIRKNKSNINVYMDRLSKIVLIIYILFGFTIEATVTPNFMSHIYLILGFVYFHRKSYKQLPFNRMSIL